MTNDKTLDITLEEGASLFYGLELTTEVENCTTNPISGEQTNCTVSVVPSDISGSTLEGSIIRTFGGSTLATFTLGFTTDGTDGAIDLSLSEADVNTIANTVRSEAILGNNPRSRDVGYYNINLISPGATSSVRLMEGRVFMSLGV